MGSFTIVSLGCHKNLVDSEYIAKKLEDKGLVQAEDGDYIIVNTCAFIEDAVRESIDTILELAAKKKDGSRLICVGCLVERYGKSLVKLLPEVDLFVGRSYYPHFEMTLDQRGILKGNEPFYETYPRKILSKLPVAFLKIQEGCDNNCTYCKVPKIRGRLISRQPEKIIEEFKWLLDSGFREINIVGQDITSYGKDISLSLLRLLRSLTEIEGEYFIRLLYLHPKGIDDELIDFIAEEKRIIKYLDIPIQHSESRILKLMGRGYDREYLEDLLAKLRDKISGIVLRTTVITGFPTETEEEFSSLCSFLEKAKFNYLGAFPYFREDGTLASRLKGQIKNKVKGERLRKVMELQRRITAEFLKGLKGKIMKAVVEEEGKPYKIGRLLIQAPDVDGIAFIAGEVKEGQIVDTRIVKTLDYDVVVEAQGESYGTHK